MVKISIIIPVHNSEAYLERCINSLLTQTYKNIEIIIVDDVSNDDSAKIMNKYEKEYSKYIKCFYLKENMCAGGARNIGIVNASGKYITFVDSDDYVRKDMLEKMYNKIQTNDYDACICNCIMSDITNGNITLHNCFYKEVMGNLDFDKRRINILLNDSVCWGILIKTDILRNNIIYFPERNMCEDYVWKCIFWTHINSIEMVDEGLYVYTCRKNSLSRIKNRNKDFEKSIQWLRKWKNDIKNTKEENKLFFYGMLRCLNILLLYYSSLEKTSDCVNIIEEIKNICNYLGNDIKIYLNDSILKGKIYIENIKKFSINSLNNMEVLYYYRYTLFKIYIDNIISEYKNNDYMIYIFGAGKKGIAFLEAIDKDKCRIDGIIDSDKSKWGNKTTTGHVIESIRILELKKSIVFIINRNYYSFVECEVSNLQNKEIKLVNLDIELCKTIKTLPEQGICRGNQCSRNFNT